MNESKFINHKKIPVWHTAPSFCDFFGGMEWVQNETTRSPIRAPEVVRRDVKHVWNFLTVEIRYVD